MIGAAAKKAKLGCRADGMRFVFQAELAERQSFMRELILKMHISVDGFVGGPNGEVDWVFKGLNADATEWVVRGLWQAGVHIMGRRTFFDMAAYWPYSTEPYAPPMNAVP